MFYLNTFFKFIFKYVFVGIPFLFLTVLLFFHIQNGAFFNPYLSSDLKIKQEKPYFLALIKSEENVERIMRKMNSLPGVAHSQKYDNQELRLKLFELFKEQVELVENFSFDGIKVVFQDDVSKKSRELIREYLVRYVGEEKIFLGGIVEPPQVSAKSLNPVRYSLSLWGTIGTTLLWFIFFSLFVFKTTNPCYVIENFQSKKAVRFKVISSGLSFLFILMVLISQLFVRQTNWTYTLALLVLVATACLLSRRKVKWQTN
jgi:hypothetical protein